MRRFAPLLLLAVACDPADKDRGDDTGGPAADDTGGADSGDPVEEPVGEGCRAEPAAADRDRVVIVSYPYTEDGAASSRWAALRLTAEGALEETGQVFTMGRAWAGRVRFTPDGSVGLAVQDDGTVGVFAVAEDGTVSVIDEGFAGDGQGFYATSVVPDPSGEIAWVIDGNWPENGGGLYRVAIDCETGALSGGERVTEAKLPADLHVLPSDLGKAVLVGREIPGAGEGADVALIDLAQPATAIAGADAFGDEEAIVSSSALTAGGRFVLIGDYSAFSGIPNRVAVAAVEEDALKAVQVVEVNDPVSIVASPFDDAALVLDGYGNAVHALVYDPEDAGDGPFSLGSPVDYAGAPPQLPGAADVLRRGSEAGLVVITETEGVRTLRFEPGGAVTDAGVQVPAGGLEFMPGAVGIQP